VTRKHNISKIQASHGGDKIITQIQPIGPGVVLGVQGRSPMTALVKREESKVRAEGGEDRAVRQGVETVGVQKDDIHRSSWRAKIEDRHPAATFEVKRSLTGLYRGHPGLRRSRGTARFGDVPDG